MRLDDDKAQELGNFSEVTPDEIEKFLVTMLTEIGRDLDALQASEAAKPEMEGMIALAVVRSPAVREIVDRFGYR